MLLRKIHICLYFLLLVLCSPARVHAQYFIWGTEPDMKWKSTSTPNLNLISPKNFTADSAFLTEFDAAITLQTKLQPSVPKRLNVILHPNTLVSNGFVAWAPARSEIFTVPARDFYPGFWPAQLAWHEMRHFGQYSIAKKQLKQRIGWLFGEYITVGMMGLVVPSWYIEGDATNSETALLNTGRGRSPTFSTPLFALINSQKDTPDYDHFLLGSYQHFFPDQYLYGYWMLSLGQQKFGYHFWPEVYAGTFMKSNFGMFPRTFKKSNPDALALRNFHKQSLAELKNLIRSDLTQTELTHTVAITQSKDYSNYRPLGCDQNGNVIAFVKPLHGEPCFIRIDSSGRERILRRTNYVHDESFGFDGRFVYYCEYRPHPRREMVDYTHLCRLDVENGSVDIVFRKDKFLIPSVSANGKFLAACSYHPEGNYTIIIYNTATDSIIHTFDFDYDEQPLSLAIDNDGNALYVIFQKQKRRALYAFNLNESKPVRYTSGLNISETDNINSLSLMGDWLYFGSARNGNDEVYRINVKSHFLFGYEEGDTLPADRIPQPDCITNTRFGACFPVAGTGTGILFSVLDSNGYQIHRMDNPTPVPSQQRWEFMFSMADALSSETRKEFDHFTYNQPDSTVPYRKGKHLFHVHSWGPVTVDPSAGSINPGIQFDSQNMLSTLTTSVFSGYNLSTATIESGARVSWFGSYPVFSAAYTHYMPFDSGSVCKTYHSLNTTVSLPLQFTHHAWTYQLKPEVELRPWGLVDGVDTTYEMTRYAAYLSFSVYQYTNSRNMYPRLGFFTGLAALWQDFDQHQGLLKGGTVGVWLPGVFRHDGFRLRAGFEDRDSLAWPFGTVLSAPRGYNLVENRVKTFGSLEYTCPLLYPDFHIGSLFYLKRISGQISYDFAEGIHQNSFSSLGFHLYTDIHFLRLYVPFRFVFSEYWLNPANRWMFQFGFSYDFYAY